MKTFSYTIRDEAGIHARPAGLIVKKCKESGCSVEIKHGDKTADGTKLFSIMSLGVKTGDTVEVAVTGDNEEEAANMLFKFFEENL